MIIEKSGTSIMNKMIIILFLFIVLSLINFSNFAYSENTVDVELLSLADVNFIYHSNANVLQIKCVLLNTSSNDITVLTDHLNTDYIKDSNKYVIGMGSKTVEYQGYNIVESLYKFSPVTLKPKEGTFINHLIKRPSLRINKNTDFIVRYEIKENFGKRFNVWYGAVESGPIKPKKTKK